MAKRCHRHVPCLRFSAALGYCTEAAADRAAAHFRAVGLPTRIAEIPGDKPDVEAMMRLMAQDKKVRQGKLTSSSCATSAKRSSPATCPPDKVRAFLGGEIGPA